MADLTNRIRQHISYDPQLSRIRALPAYGLRNDLHALGLSLYANAKAIAQGAVVGGATGGLLDLLGDGDWECATLGAVVGFAVNSLVCTQRIRDASYARYTPAARENA